MANSYSTAGLSNYVPNLETNTNPVITLAAINAARGKASSFRTVMRALGKRQVRYND